MTSLETRKTTGGAPGRRASRNAPSANEQKQMLRKLILLREFDLTCERWWKAGEPLVGEFHLSLGQEGFTIGTCAAVKDDDLICPSIRGMGVYLYRGVPMVKLIASFFEREGSISGGRWAHWHSPAMDVGILPQTGMLGAGLVTAVGVALTQKLNKTGRVVVGMLGDGASNTGYFHEGVNFAAAKQLPIVIIIENNQIAVSTSIRDTARVENLSDRAKGYGIPGQTVDASDVFAVSEAVAAAAERARSGGGPTLLELKAWRWGGQTLKDPDRNRTAEQKESYRKACPIEKLKADMVARELISEDEFASVVTAVRKEIADAESAARALPKLDGANYPDPVSAFPVYATL